MAFTIARLYPCAMDGLLFLCPADPRAAVLATGAYQAALDLLPGPAAVICPPRAAPLYRAAPRLETLEAMPDSLFGALRAMQRFRKTRFALMADFRGWRMLRAGFRAGRVIRREDAEARGSVVEQWRALLGGAPVTPKLWFDEEARLEAQTRAGEGPFILIAPGAADERGRWPAERYAAVARRLATGAFPGARAVLVGGPEDRVEARALGSSLDADGVKVRDLVGSLDLLAAGAVAARAALCIGGDGAWSYAAAAAGAPTLALFGPSDERVLAPLGPRARCLRGRAFEDLMAMAQTGAPPRSLMDDIGVDAVEAAALDLLRAGGL